MDWLKNLIAAHYVPDAERNTPAGSTLDVLGKPPSIPPKAVALAYDIQGPVMRPGTRDLSVQVAVLR